MTPKPASDLASEELPARQLWLLLTPTQQLSLFQVLTRLCWEIVEADEQVLSANLKSEVLDETI